MKVILLERIPRLGQMGDTVKVKDGFARNYLLPQGKALRANAENLARFEAERAQLEARNLERKEEAAGVASKLDGNSYIIIRSAGETGQLYGSVSTRDIAETLDQGGFSVAKNQVQLNIPIKTIGLHSVMIMLHAEVEASVTINVARSEDEAERQAKGEDLSKRESDRYAEEEAEEEIDLDEIFENPDEVEIGDEAAAETSEEAEEEATEEENKDEA
jgi:large subunit ribosomal protein L9